MLERLRLGPKLLLAPALVLLLLIVGSGSAWWATVRHQGTLETIVDVRAARIREVSQLAGDTHAAHARIYQLLTWIAASMSAPRTRALVADIHGRHAAVAATFGRMKQVPGADLRLLAEGEQAWHRYVQAVQEVIELSRGDQSVAASAMVKAERAFEHVSGRLAQLGQREQALSEAASRQAAREVAAMSLLMPALVAVSVALALLISRAVRRSLLSEVRTIAQVALDLASGNLTVPKRDYGGDEIAETSRVLDESIRNLNGTLKGIIDSASALGEASEASGAMVEKLARVMASTPDGISKLLDWPDACAVLDTREMNTRNCALIDEAAAVAAALQGQASSLSLAVSSIKLDGAPAASRKHLWLASTRE